MLLLCALMAGGGSAWAEDVTTTYVFQDRDWKAKIGTTDADWTCNTRAGGFTDNQGTQVTKSSTGANATSPVSFTNVKKIEITYCTNNKAGAGTIKVKVGSGTEQSFSVSAPSSGGTTLKTTDFTFSPTETGYVTLTVDCTTNSIYIYSIAITTEETDSSEPSITASNVELECDDINGEISYTINNAVVGATLSASSETSWISNVSVDAANSLVTFSTTANETASDREGTVTLTYMDGEDELATKNVTVLQKRSVVTYTYALANTIVPGRHYIITNGSDVAMGEDRGSNRAAVAITISNNSTSIASDAGVYEFLIGFDGESGYFTIYDETNNGYLCSGSSSSNHLKWSATLNDNGKWSIEIDENGIATIKSHGSYTRNWMRYNSSNNPPIFSCYASGQNDIYLFERDGDTGSQDFTATINAACTDGQGKYYATFSAPFAFTVPSDVTVSEIGVIDKELLVEDYEAGAIIPANTGVMISSATAGDKTFTSAKGGTSALGDDNDLRPTYWGVSADDMSAAYASRLFYRLTMHNGTDIGFWWGAENGAAFALAANKAYLAVPQTQARQGFSLFGDEPDGIDATFVDNAGKSGEVFNLQGQRVGSPKKGMYIVNGKKVVMK